MPLEYSIGWVDLPLCRVRRRSRAMPGAPGLVRPSARSPRDATPSSGFSRLKNTSSSQEQTEPGARVRSGSRASAGFTRRQSQVAIDVPGSAQVRHLGALCPGSLEVGGVEPDGARRGVAMQDLRRQVLPVCAFSAGKQAHALRGVT